jgi:pimeloyl-ACP methyl ester carboxylesterase
LATSVGYTTERVPLAQTELYLLKGGAGHPCLVLHGVEGNEGWLAFHDRLAEQATVYAPSHPGYGQTECPDWISSVQHQAVFYNWFLQEAGIDSVDLVGVGVGGWIAAEMAVMCSAPLRHLVLVDAAGLRPEQGELLDIFLIPWREVIERSFYAASDAAEYQRIYGNAPIQDFGGVREAGRTMSTRMCFKPYMYNPALAGTLGKVRVPTLVVWGQQDAIVPLQCGQLYRRMIPGATLRVIDSCGHFAHLEQPDRLAAIVQEFLAV